MTEKTLLPSNNPATGQKRKPNQNGPYTKGQIYGASLPSYRLKAPKKKSRKGCCRCCLCLFLLLLALLLVVGIAGLVVWVIYRPELPKISVTSVQIPMFTLAKNTQYLTYEFILKLRAWNPNKKVSFIYDDFTVKLSSGDVDIGDGSVPGFFHGTGNTTAVMADLKRQNMALDASDAKKLKSAKSKGNIMLDVKVGTHVGVKMSKWKSPKVRVEVNCHGISAVFSKAKLKPTADSNSKCMFKVRIKVFKWYL